MSATIHRPPECPPDSPEVVTRIGPLAYLRSVWAVMRGALLHPFSTTLVDLSTGESVEIPPGRAPEWPGR